MRDQGTTLCGTYTDRQGRIREIHIDLSGLERWDHLRGMTEAERFAEGMRWMDLMIRLHIGLIALEHPGWTRAQVRDELARRRLGDELWAKVKAARAAG